MLNNSIYKEVEPQLFH